MPQAETAFPNRSITLERPTSWLRKSRLTPQRAPAHRQQVSAVLHLARGRLFNYALQSSVNNSHPYRTKFSLRQIALVAINLEQFQSLNEILSTPE